VESPTANDRKAEVGRQEEKRRKKLTLEKIYD
jgi:hypothetical protein